MKVYGKFVLAIGMIVFFTVLGIGLHGAANRDVIAVVTREIEGIKAPKVSYITDDFILPDGETDLPVYDRYTIGQRKEKGLPTTYGTK